MNAAKTGFIAEFVTGYLQREIRMEAAVQNGTDAGLRNSSDTGIAVGRLVKFATVEINGVNTLAMVPATGVSATSIGDATHIVAQSDDTIRDVPEDYNYPEKYSTLPNLIVKNSDTAKTLAVYKIINADDVKIISL